MLEVHPYEESLESKWDQYCRGSVNGTFLHTRRFLSYHGARYRDRSVIVLNQGEIAGVFPAAESIDDPATVVSHPGATYGGLVHDGWLTGQRMLDAFEAIRSHYKAVGFAELRYKPVPHIYATCPADDDSYALFRLGARRVRCDLSSCIDLDARRAPSQRRRRALRKARTNVVICDGMKGLTPFYRVLAGNLAERHSAIPVHRLDELEVLVGRFPNEITLSVATIDDQVVAGVLFFRTPRVVHAQYIASSQEGFEASALDAILEDAIGSAIQEGARFFDFGISNEDEGLVLNEGLYRFKTEFGGGGVIHEQYAISCADVSC